MRENRKMRDVAADIVQRFARDTLMMSEDVLSTLSELAEVLQTQRTLGGELANIAEAATVSVPRCDAASVAL